MNQIKSESEMKIHRLAIDSKGYFLETCHNEEIRLILCKCENEVRLG